MVSSSFVQFLEVDLLLLLLLFTFKSHHFSQTTKMYAYYQGFPFILEAVAILLDSQYIFKGDIGKLKCIQNKMTRIVKGLETCHERNASVILCSRKWDVESERCPTSLEGVDSSLRLFEDLPCESRIPYFLSSSRGQTWTDVWQVQELVSTVYKQTSPAAGVVVSALLLMPREL